MQLCDINEINALLAGHGFRFQRSKGQNFLIAPWVPERIAEGSGADKSTGVLEIGPGIGCLTAELAKRAACVTAVELDSRLIPVLSETLSGLDNVTVVNADIMSTDLEALVRERFSGLTPAVCANLPYNITSPVLTKLIDSGLFRTITVMVQREVARRICAAPGTADYGAFGIYVNFYALPELLFDVPPSCFEPRPKVTSSVIRLTLRPAPAEDVDKELFFRVVRSAFNQRRKTLVNALSAGFPQLKKDAVTRCVSAAKIPEGARGETLSIPDFAALTRELERRIRDDSAS